MGAFDPIDSPDLPPVVRRYAECRRRYVETYPQWTDLAFADAAEAMRRELAARGGRWEVGGLIYHLEGRGIGIEQAAAAADTEGQGGSS